MKDFLVIANQNAITYKELFPFLKKGQVSVGYTKPTEYLLPNGEIQKSGDNIWFSTLPTPGKKQLILTKTYNPQDYPKYDNYDAIEVGRIKDIPYNYDGVMGVPITILGYDLENVEIMGEEVIHNKDTKIEGKEKYRRVLIKKKIEVRQLCASHGKPPEE